MDEEEHACEPEEEGEEDAPVGSGGFLEGLGLFEALVELLLPLLLKQGLFLELVLHYNTQIAANENQFLSFFSFFLSM